MLEKVSGLKAEILVIKRSVGVATEVNLRNLSPRGNKTDNQESHRGIHDEVEVKGQPTDQYYDRTC